MCARQDMCGSANGTYEVALDEEVPLPLRHIKLHSLHMGYTQSPDIVINREDRRWDAAGFPCTVDSLIDLRGGGVDGGEGADLLRRRAEDLPGSHGDVSLLSDVTLDVKCAGEATYPGQRAVPDQEGFSVLMKSQKMCSARLFDAE